LLVLNVLTLVLGADPRVKGDFHSCIVIRIYVTA
jgi:hypothetical protein